jgi:transcriptional antiterminator Rof (Rho-off)
MQEDGRRYQPDATKEPGFVSLACLFSLILASALEDGASLRAVENDGKMRLVGDVNGRYDNERWRNVTGSTRPSEVALHRVLPGPPIIPEPMCKTSVSRFRGRYAKILQRS